MSRSWPRQPEPNPGQLLVSTPVTRDPNFDRTVLLMVDHDEKGSLGLVLNRPTDQPVPGGLSRWGDAADGADHLLAGGPVEPDALLAVGSRSPGHAGDPPDSAMMAVDHDLWMLDLTTDPGQLDPSIDELRIFTGYAGWGPGQLTAELGADGWWVLDRQPGDLVGGEALWARVLRRHRGLQRFATLPADPSHN